METILDPVGHCTSAVVCKYAQSNGRAELAGQVDTTRMMKALLQYRNTPFAITGMSPAYMLFGQNLKDALPSIPISHDPTTMSYSEKYGKPSSVWSGIKSRIEIAYARKRTDDATRYNSDKHPLPPLSIGDSVSIQNRRGSHLLRWDRTGVVVERLEHRKYLVKFDGSGNVPLRTRSHLWKIDPATQRALPIEDGRTDPVATEPLLIPGCLRDGTRIIEPVAPGLVEPGPVVPEGSHGAAVPATDPVDHPEQSDNSNDGAADAPSVPVAPRHSERQRKPKMMLSPNLSGKRHDEVVL